MNILSGIIRGGQLSLHAIRMFKQVLNLLIYCTVIIAIILFIYGVYSTSNLEQWRGFRDYRLAKLYISMMAPKKKMEAWYGEYKTVLQAKSVESSSVIKEAHDELIGVVVGSVNFAVKGAGTIFILISILFIIRGYKRSGEQFKRGAKLSLFDEVKTKIIKNNRKKSYKGFSIAKMPYPHLGETQHTLVMGANGSGKTVLISDLVEQIRKSGGKAIVYDKKCDYTKWFYREEKDYILNPFDKRSENWSILKEIKSLGTVKQLAKAFVPDKKNHNNDDQWGEAARLAFTAIIEKLYSKKQDLSNRELVDMILRADLKEVEKLLKGTYAQATIDTTSPKTAASVLFTMANHFNGLRLTNGKKDESFSIRDWVLSDKEDSMIFITSEENVSSELAPLQTAWFEIAISSILSKPDSNQQKTWVIIDELPSLQSIPSLASGLATVRSYKGCMVLGMQNIAQMRGIYGIHKTQSISSECNTRCIFKSGDPDTASWMSTNIGETEIIEYKEGLSYGANTIRDGVNVSKQERVKKLFLPVEIQNMKKLEMILKMPEHYAVRTKIEYKKRDAKVAKYIENEELILDLNKIYNLIPEKKATNKKESKESDGNKKEVCDQEQSNENINKNEIEGLNKKLDVVLTNIINNKDKGVVSVKEENNTTKNKTDFNDII